MARHYPVAPRRELQVIAQCLRLRGDLVLDPLDLEFMRRSGRKGVALRR
jgi:hypothetical protein